MKIRAQHKNVRQRGSVLIEIAVAYGTLVTVAVLTLKAAVNTTSGQAWTVKQSMTDAYLTRETALASRIPFDEVTSDGSLWALHPSVTTSTVEIGKLPGGSPVLATIHRTRIPDANNLSTAGGTGTTATNPGRTEAWKLQSLLVYTIAEREYVKTRTALRIR
ncbi:MAG: hypothetical protein CMO47_12100 [Verrucomicrobiales bacterium]|jgi:hypothetical protein|nr:hypothetical protein [Verrucomicrobiales bacterium]|tara:strand:- start:10324 stop:10809 length:486 start_codon:yes stop_codon:yes gene_type:complete